MMQPLFPLPLRQDFRKAAAVAQLAAERLFMR